MAVFRISALMRSFTLESTMLWKQFVQSMQYICFKKLLVFKNTSNYFLFKSLKINSIFLKLNFWYCLSNGNVFQYEIFKIWNFVWSNSYHICLELYPPACAFHLNQQPMKSNVNGHTVTSQKNIGKKNLKEESNRKKF